MAEGEITPREFVLRVLRAVDEPLGGLQVTTRGVLHVMQAIQRGEQIPVDQQVRIIAKLTQALSELEQLRLVVNEFARDVDR